MFSQEVGDVIWGHINGTLASSSGGVAIGSSVISGMVCYFLATDASLMSFDFAIKAFVFVHELLLFSVGVSLSHFCGVDIHSVSSLRGGAWSGIFVSSILIASSLVLPRCQSEGFVKPCFLLTELRGGQPLLMRFSGLFFPFLKGPWRVCIWIEAGGMDDCSGEQWFHGVFEDFNSSLVI